MQFDQVQRNYRKNLDNIAQLLQVQTQEQWYSVNKPKFKKLGGSKYLPHSKIYWALKRGYSEYEWLPWRFSFNRKRTWNWNSNASCRLFCDWLAAQLGIEESSQWYSVTAQCFEDNGATALLQRCEYSVAKVCESVYPEYEWYPWMFACVPNKYWDQPEHCRRYCDWLAAQLDIEEQSQWYAVKVEALSMNYGGTLPHRYKANVYHILSNVYPEFQWHPWLFTHVPKQWWKHIANQRQFLDWAAEQLHIHDPLQWADLPARSLLASTFTVGEQEYSAAGREWLDSGVRQVLESVEDYLQSPRLECCSCASKHSQTGAALSVEASLTLVK